MLRYFKNLLAAFLLWLRSPKIGYVVIEVKESPSNQDVRIDKDSLDVDLTEWQDTIKATFETDNFVTEGVYRANRPNDEVLKAQIRMFYKDYRNLNKRVDQLYTKTLKYEEHES